jgi:hypothetical protein
MGHIFIKLFTSALYEKQAQSFYILLTVHPEAIVGFQPT